MSSRKTRRTCRHWITRSRFSHHWGSMSLRSVGCVDIYCGDCRFSLDLRLILLGLLLLVLCAVISSYLGANSAVILRSRAASSGLCMTIQDNAANEKAALPVGASNSIVMGLHFFLESVSVCCEELFKDVVDHITDTARLALRWQEHEPYRLNELRLYADFWEPTAEVAYVPFTQIGLAEMGRYIWLNIGVVCHNYGLVVKHGGSLSTVAWTESITPY